MSLRGVARVCVVGRRGNLVAMLTDVHVYAV